MRAVVDVDVLVRALIKPDGTVGPVVKALRDAHFVFLYSDALLAELVDVLRRPRLRDKVGLAEADVETIVALVLLRGEPFTPTRRIAACRDPKDDMLLELAVAGRADVIVSGDEDLLVLDPFGGMRTLGPAALLALLDVPSIS